MNRRFYGAIILSVILLFSGCVGQQQKTVCNPPEILVGAGCCLDENGDRICDGEQSPTTTSVEAVATTTASTTTTLKEEIVETTTITPETSTTTIIKEKKSSPEKLWEFKAGGNVTDVALSDDADGIILGSSDGYAYMLDRSGLPRWNISAGDKVNSVDITPNGKYIALGFRGITEASNPFYYLRYDRQILWKSTKPEHIYGNVDKVSVMPTGSNVVLSKSITTSGYVGVYNASGHTFWTKATNKIGDLKAAVDYNVVLGDRTNRLYYLSNDSVIWKQQFDSNVNTLDSTWDVSLTVAGLDNGEVYLFDSSGKKIWSYKTGDSIRHVDLSEDGEYVAVGSADKNVYLFNKKGDLLVKYETTWDVNKVKVGYGGEYVAAGSRDKNVYLLDKRGSLIWVFETGGPIVDLEVTPKMDYLGVVSGDGKMYLLKGPGSSETGETIKIKCFNDGDCGGTKEVYYCKSGDVAKGTQINYCTSSGTEKSFCSQRTTFIEITKECKSQGKSCIEGENKCEN